MLESFYTNRLTVFLLIISTFVGGFWAFQNLPVALYPPTSKPKIEISLRNMPMERQEFIDTYGQNLESQLMAIKDVEKVSATYDPKGADWKVEFSWGVKPEEAKTRTEAVTNGFTLPSDWSSKFGVSFSESTGSSWIYISLSHPFLSPSELYERLGTILEKRLESVPGKDTIFVSQPSYKKIIIELIHDRLLSFGLRPSDIERVLREKKYDKSLGDIKSEGGQNISVLSIESYQNIQDLKYLVISEKESRKIQLQDVANIQLQTEAPPHLIHNNGERGLICGGRAKPDVNIVTFADTFEEIVRTEAHNFDPRVEVHLLSSPSLFVNSAIDNLVQSVLLGMGIATIIMFLFLASFWQTFVIALSIPLSLFGGFIVMSLVGMELNLISLGGMALAVGMVVDGAVVVLENIVRHFQERRPSTSSDRLEVLIAAMSEVKISIFASLLTTIIVFTPLIFTAPLTYALLGDLAKVIVCVLVISLFVTLVIVPPLLLIRQPKEPSQTVFNRFIDGISKWYLSVLAFGLKSAPMRYGLYSFLSALLGLSIFLMGKKLKTEVMAEPDSDKVWLCMDIPTQKTMDDAEKKIKAYEDIIKTEFSEDLTHFFTNLGKKYGCILSNLKDKKNLESYKKRLEERFQNTPEVQFYVHKWTPSEMDLPKPSILKIKIRGSTLAESMTILEKMSQSLSARFDNLRVKTYPDPYQARFYQFHFYDSNSPWKSLAQDHLKYALSESLVHYFSEDQTKIPIYLSYPKNFLVTQKDFENLLMRQDEKIIPLRHFAQIKEYQTFARVYREQGKDEVRLDIKTTESFKGNKDQLKIEVLDYIKDLKIDQGALSFEPTDVEVQKNIQSLISAIFIALALIWLLMSIQFSRLDYVLIIMLAIPLGLIGVGLSLYLFGSTLCVNSMLGMILLCGTAVNNSIIFIDFFEQTQKSELSQRLSIENLILRTARLRFRPILITTLTTILGMLPISFGLGEGGEILQPLGIAVCGGLTVSTLLTLIVVPLVLFSVEKKGYSPK